MDGCLAEVGSYVDFTRIFFIFSDNRSLHCLRVDDYLDVCNQKGLVPYLKRQRQLRQKSLH